MSWVTSTVASRPRRRLSRWKLAGVVVLAALTAAVSTCAFLVAWFVLPTLWVTLDEMGLPPAPDVTEGLVVTSDEMGCGSGGCWRELTVRPPAGQSPEDFIAASGLGSWTCGARTWFDRRPVCTEARVDDGSVAVHLQYDRIQ